MGADRGAGRTIDDVRRRDMTTRPLWPLLLGGGSACAHGSVTILTRLSVAIGQKDVSVETSDPVGVQNSLTRLFPIWSFSTNVRTVNDPPTRPPAEQARCTPGLRRQNVGVHSLTSSAEWDTMLTIDCPSVSIVSYAASAVSLRPGWDRPCVSQPPGGREKDLPFERSHFCGAGHRVSRYEHLLHTSHRRLIRGMEHVDRDILRLGHMGCRNVSRPCRTWRWRARLRWPALHQDDDRSRTQDVPLWHDHRVLERWTRRSGESPGSWSIHRWHGFRYDLRVMSSPRPLFHRLHSLEGHITAVIRDDHAAAMR